MIVVTAQQMQAMDKRTIDQIGIPGMVLMENAGRGFVSVMWQQFPQLEEMHVGVVAGRGNNGGDGFVIARYLSQARVQVTVFLLAEKDLVGGDAAINLTLLDQLQVHILQIPTEEALAKTQSQFKKPNLWVDAILGTGLNSVVRGRYKKVIDLLNQTGEPILAVDIPSGIDADTGQLLGTAIQAHTTVTFGHPKIGHLQYPGRHLSGAIQVVNIGIPESVTRYVAPKQQLLTEDKVRAILPRRAPDDHKGRSGHVLVLGGSPGKTGAPAMSANGAVRSGAGLVTLGVAADLNGTVEPLILESMSLPLPHTKPGILGISALDQILEHTLDKRCVAIGPGLGTHPSTVQLVLQLLKDLTVPLVIDADGLNCMAERPTPFKNTHAPIVITPHPGEMSRLMGIETQTIQTDRVGHARRYACDNGIWVVLKGAATVIADPQGQVWINPTGNPGMASGGMGDVLTGIIAGLIAQQLTPTNAACAGVYLHGLAANHVAQTVSPWGYGAGDLIPAIPVALGQLLTSNTKRYHPFIQALP